MLYALMINRMKFESWIIKKILKEKSLKIVTIDKTNQIEDSRKKNGKGHWMGQMQMVMHIFQSMGIAVPLYLKIAWTFFAQLDNYYLLIITHNIKLLIITWRNFFMPPSKLASANLWPILSWILGHIFHFHLNI